MAVNLGEAEKNKKGEGQAKKFEDKIILNFENETGTGPAASAAAAAAPLPTISGASRYVTTTMKIMDGNTVRIKMPPEAAEAVVGNGVFIRVNTNAVASAVASAIAANKNCNVYSNGADGGGGDGGEGSAGNNGNRRRNKSRELFGVFTLDAMAWMICHYFCIAMFCLSLAVSVMINCEMQDYVEVSALFLWLVGISSLVLSIVVEKMKVDHVQLYSNLFSGMFLACISVYFTVFPPMGMFCGLTVLILATVATNYAVLGCMIKTISYEVKTGRRLFRSIPYFDFGCCGCDAVEENKPPNGAEEEYCFLFYFGLVSFVPGAVFMASQILYIFFVGLEYDKMDYVEFSINVFVACLVAILISLERFGFMYRVIQAAMEREDKMEMTVMNLISDGNRNNNNSFHGMDLSNPAPQQHHGKFRVADMRSFMGDFPDYNIHTTM